MIQMKSMVATCCAIRHESVRLCTIESLGKLENLKKSVGKSLNNMVLDTLLLLTRDPLTA